MPVDDNASSVTRVPATKGRVLLVDDEAVILECLTAILLREKLEVHAVTTASAAIAALDAGQFDVVITDMAMETRTSGYEVVRAAQQQAYPPEVFILTGFYIPAAEWQDKGVRQLFTKGEGMPEDLVQAVMQIFGDIRRHRGARAARQRLGA